MTAQEFSEKCERAMQLHEESYAKGDDAMFGRCLRRGLWRLSIWTDRVFGVYRKLERAFRLVPSAYIRREISVIVRPPTAAWTIDHWSPWHYSKRGRCRFLCRVCGLASLKLTLHEPGCKVAELYAQRASSCRECHARIVLQSDHRTACDEIYRLVARQAAGTLTGADSHMIGLSRDEVEAMIAEWTA